MLTQGVRTKSQHSPHTAHIWAGGFHWNRWNRKEKLRVQDAQSSQQLKPRVKAAGKVCFREADFFRFISQKPIPQIRTSFVYEANSRVRTHDEAPALAHDAIHPVYWIYCGDSNYPPQNKQHSLLVLPTASAILNFATEFFEMLTKKQSEHPQTVFQVFQVFRVFQVFHFAFGPQNRPVLVQIRTKPKNRNYSAMQ